MEKDKKLSKIKKINIDLPKITTNLQTKRSSSK
jgi:hypothetical protein